MLKSIGLLLCLITPLSLMAAIEPSRSSVYYEDALAFFSSESYPEAIIELKNALQLEPTNLSARILLGRALLAHDEPNSAIKEFERALQEGGDENLILTHLAKAYLAILLPEKVITLIQPKGHLPDVDAKLWVLKGDAFMQYRRLDQARNAYQQSGKLAPQNLPAALGLVRVEIARGQFQIALETLDSLLVKHPLSVEIWTLKAMLLRDLGRRPDAMKALDTALGLDSNNIKALGVRAGIWMDFGQYDKAENDLKHLRERSPGDLEGIYLTTLLYLRRNDSEAANKLLAETSETLLLLKESHRSKLPQSQLMLGIISYFEQDYQQSIAYLRSFLKQFPKHSGAIRYLVAAYLNINEAKEVMTLLRPGVGEDYPQDPMLLSMLAEAYRSTGLHSKAIELYKKAQALAPGQAGIGLRLAVSKFETGDKQAALHDLEELYRQVPDLQEAGMQLTRLYAKLGRTEEALATIQQLAKKHPEDPVVITLYAVTSVAAGDEIEAEKLFTRAIQLDESFMLPRMGLARLALHRGDLDMAIASLQKITEMAPENIGAHVDLANIYVKQKRFDEASALLERVFTLDPKHVKANLLGLRILYYQGNREKLDARMHELQKNFPDDEYVLLDLSALYANLGEADSAQLLLRHLVANAGYKADILHQAAVQQMAINRNDDALYALTKALQANPKHLSSLASMVTLFLTIDNRQKAEEALGNLRRQHPDALLTAIITGDYYRTVGKPQEAVDYYKSAFDLEPDQSLLQTLFKTKLAAGQVDEAIALMQSWLSKSPEDTSSRLLLASAYMLEKRFDQALSLYETLHSENSQDPLILNNLAILHQQKGDTQALGYAEQAYKLLPKHPSILDTYGWILVDTGSVKEGLVLLRDAHARQSTNHDIRYHIAEALVKLERYREARTELNEILNNADKGKFSSQQKAESLLNRIKAK